MDKNRTTDRAAKTPVGLLESTITARAPAQPHATSLVGQPAQWETAMRALKRSEQLLGGLRKLAAQSDARASRRLAAQRQASASGAAADLPPEPSALESLAKICAPRPRASTAAGDARTRWSGGRMIRQDSDAHQASRLAMNQTHPPEPPRDASPDAAMADVIQPAYPMAPLAQVTDSQLTRYARLIYEKTGIRVSPQKKMLLSNRLRRRLRQTGIRDFDSYYRHLKCLSLADREWDEFYQEITTHETYLFRDENQWDWFSNVYLQRHAASVNDRGEPRRLRIWSAACSTGDEAYTIASCVAASLMNLGAWDVDILGTDLAAGDIREAKLAAYSQRAMRLVPRSHHRFFCHNEETDTWSPKPILRKLVRFRSHNLMTRLDERPFDIVFLKNVLIYFDKDSKRRALENVCPLVRPGGLLVAGAAEGVASLIGGFRRLEPWLFERVR